MKDISIVVSVCPNREEYLEFNFESWVRSINFANATGDICVHYEGFEPGHDFSYLKELLLPGVELKLHDGGEKSGSQITGYNVFIARSSSRVMLFAHPEIWLQEESVMEALEYAKDDVFTPFRVFFLNEEYSNAIVRGNGWIPQTTDSDDM